MATILALCLLLPQGAPPRKETWSEWMTIPTEVPLPNSASGWLRPPEGLEFSMDDPIPQPLLKDRPLLGGLLIVRRGAEIEAWDLAAKRKAWALPSTTGFLGWTVTYRRVTSVLPDGPADRAGVREGDLIETVNGTSLEHSWFYQVFRAGETVRLDLLSAGGRRQVTLTAGNAPRPFGSEPRVEADLGDDLLLGRDGRLERLRTADGRILWSHPGRFLCQGSGRILLEAEELRRVAVDAGTGAVAWTAALPSERYSRQSLWTDQGPVLVDERRRGLHVTRLDPATGREAWSLSADHRSEALIHAFACGRLFLSMAHRDCQSWDHWGGVPHHDGPLCLFYHVLDLPSGEIVWSRPTGGRPHGGTGRREMPRYIPFDPANGGPAKAVGERLLWFDVETERLSVIDPATLKEERSMHLPGVSDFGTCAPPGRVAFERSDGARWIDVSNGDSIEARYPWVLRRTWGFSPTRAFFLVGEKDYEILALDATARPAAPLWKKPLLDPHYPWISVQGERLLLCDQIGRSDTMGYTLLDGSTGAELFSTQLPCPTFYGRRGSGRGYRAAFLADPYLILSVTSGLHLYRRGR